MLLGSALLVAGVTLATRASASAPSPHSLRGVPEALASAIAFGAMFWLFYFYVQPAMGYTIPLLTLKMMAVLGSALAFARRPAPSAESAGDRGARGSLGSLAALAASGLVRDTVA